MNAIDPHLSALAAPALLLCMALICTLVWRYYRRHQYLLWLGASQALLAAGLTIQILQSQSLLHHTAMVTTLLYVSSEMALAHAMAQRMGQRIQPFVAGVLAMATMVGMWYFSQIEPNMPARLVVLSLGLGAILCHTLPQLLRVPARHRLDHGSLALYMLAAALTLCRPLLLLTDEPGANGAWFSHSLIWWLTLNGAMLLHLPYTATMAGSALLDTMHTLRRERDHDSLTGLLNRRAFEEVCTATPHARGVRVLVLCDIDHFKRINDEHGHTTGDEVLKQFARVLQRNLREGDVVARVGGEEFAIALWHRDLPQARSMLERLVRELAQTPCLPMAAEPTAVTASFGVVQPRPEESLLEAMQRADGLLYAAKRAGRNRIFCETEPA